MVCDFSAPNGTNSSTLFTLSGAGSAVVDLQYGRVQQQVLFRLMRYQTNPSGSDTVTIQLGGTSPNIWSRFVVVATVTSNRIRVKLKRLSDGVEFVGVDTTGNNASNLAGLNKISIGANPFTSSRGFFGGLYRLSVNAGTALSDSDVDKLITHLENNHL